MKKSVRILAILLAVSLLTGMLTGCKKSTSEETAKFYIPVIAKGFQHQFWQVVKQGSEDAGRDLGVEVYFTGPEGESAISTQVDMLNQELAKNPKAICLAALDTSAVTSQLKDAFDNNIPVIGFDSGIPNAPAGQVAATAATNNPNAAAIGAEHMYPLLKDEISAATVENPVVISVFSQDATSASVTGRTKGFAEKMYDLVKADFADMAVAITGDYSVINKGDANPAVIIKITVGATPDLTDMTNSANGILKTTNLLGIFCSNEGAVTALLAAINAGSPLPAGVQVVGFDAGSGQKAAVRSGQFLGSITQDPYQIGYKAVQLAVDAANGKPVSDIDTGAKWYDKNNMDQEDIAKLLYD
ncbi:MAG TPA: substrate-binding domain-containing protein [Oscillospiraceae bacterium]|nr:substrate-binding domain-containing protein [Oscillospiraceae bacterium]HPF55826.1 substrate-binding domain-containing protein [Clostridiales bacterium]HPK35114.1 substrate-binding domain-containing protein [Oscillospiraceae bacterium]HPR75265.1 substrate-binding domain-containing protein [Oscillospiraceae bacterium]